MRWARASISEVSGFKFQVSSSTLRVWGFICCKVQHTGTLNLKPETRTLKLVYLTSKYSITFSFQLPPTRARM